MRSAGWFWCLILTLAVTLALVPPAQALPNQIYVWNRAWTPAVHAALVQFSDGIDGWRVLAAEADSQGHLHPVAVDWAALAATHRPVTAVVRIDGSLALSDAQVRQIRQSVKHWPVAGLEIDYDCGTARLADYARFLTHLRSGLFFPLSITALPAWLKAPALDDLLAATDKVVLQVHAVLAPGNGLFDPKLALIWTDALSRRDPKPFAVALPDYGTHIVRDQDGRMIAVESEMPRLAGGASAQELIADPAAVAGFVRALAAKPPPRFTGLVWFRLPVPDDVRIWSASTLKAVMRGALPQSRIAVIQRPGAFAGAIDVTLTNDGDIDLPLPAALLLPSRCRIADGVNGYGLDAKGAKNFLRRLQNGLLRAHDDKKIGWMRCDGTPSEIEVSP